MKEIKKIIFFSILAFACIFAIKYLFANVFISKREVIIKNANEYLEQKYNKSFEIESFRWSTYGTGIATRINRNLAYLEFTDGEIKFDVDYSRILSQKFTDDYQAQEIYDDVMERFVEPFFETLDTFHYGKNGSAEKIEYEVLVSTADYYDGNIEEFLDNNRVSFRSYSYIYIISENHEQAKIQADKIVNYFNEIGLGFSMNISFVTQECYQAVLNGEIRYVDQTTDGCFIRFKNNYTYGGDNFYFENIKTYAGEHFYIQTDLTDFNLEEGDITITPIMEIKDFNVMWIENAMKYSQYVSVGVSDYPVFQIVFSDKLKQHMAENNIKHFSLTIFIDFSAYPLIDKQTELFNFIYDPKSYIDVNSCSMGMNERDFYNIINCTDGTCFWLGESEIFA